MEKIIVDQSKCIGCGACVGVDPDHFDFEDSGLSSVINQDNLDSVELQEAISGCPTEAITIEGSEEEKEEA